MVNNEVRVGKNCLVSVCVNVGCAAGRPEAVPVIGDDVFIGPGAKIFGDIRIADGVAIGANAVVNKSFLEPNITIAGIPARKISDRGSQHFTRGADLALASNKNVD